MNPLQVEVTCAVAFKNLQRRPFVEVPVTYRGAIMNHMSQHLQIACGSHFTDFVRAVMMGQSLGTQTLE